MKEITIEELHEIALSIMKEIHEFCMMNNIQYSLAYGSLIGAIRHQGFIPWDDDIDVWMTRPNFDKFTTSFVSKKGYRLSSEYDNDSLICFNRVYETERTILKRNWKSCDGEVGVWVDIMPLDGVPDNEQLRTEQYKKFCKGISTMGMARYWLNYIDNTKGIALIYGIFRLSLKNWLRGNYKRVQDDMVIIQKKYDIEESEYCCYFQCGAAYSKNKQELLPVKSFKTYQLIKFEDTVLMITADYDNLLKRIYGDYMKLPPIEDRQFHHGACYWK